MPWIVDGVVCQFTNEMTKMPLFFLLLCSSCLQCIAGAILSFGQYNPLQARPFQIARLHNLDLLDGTIWFTI